MGVVIIAVGNGCGSGCTHLGYRVRRCDPVAFRDHLGDRSREPRPARRVAVGQALQDLINARPGLRVLGEACGHEAPQFRRHGGQVRFGMHQPVDHRLHPAAAERAATRRGEGEHAAQGEHVARGGDFLSERLLGRHVRGRPQQRPGRGARRRIQGAGDAEVDDARAVGGDHDVGRLQVPVHETSGVDRREALRQTGADRAHGLDGERPVGVHRGLERRPRDVARRHPRPVGAGVRVHHRRGVETADPACRGDLALEPPPEPVVGGQLRAHDLDRDLTPTARPSQIDDSHPPAAQTTEQTVGTYVGRITCAERFGEHGPAFVGRLHLHGSLPALATGCKPIWRRAESAPGAGQAGRPNPSSRTSARSLVRSRA